MHPETKKLTQKHACLTLTENLKLQLSTGLVASYDIQPGNGVGLGQTHTHTFTYLLTCPGHTWKYKTAKCSREMNKW